MIKIIINKLIVVGNSFYFHVPKSFVKNGLIERNKEYTITIDEKK